MPITRSQIEFAFGLANVDQRNRRAAGLAVASAYTCRPFLGETRIPSLTNSSLADPTSPPNGFSAAILRIKLRSLGGIGRRPALHFKGQKIRYPSRGQRTAVAGCTTTTASRQSKSLENSASCTRVV